MSLLKSFARAAKKAAVGLTILSLAFLAACGYPQHQLGGTEPLLQGQTIAEVMFDGAPAQNHVNIDASALQSKNNYTYSGSVTINGNVPANTEITVTGGRLIVNGDVGDGAEISVTMPQRTHSETYHYTTFIMVGKTMMPMMHTGTRTVIDGLAYPGDRHPAVQVTGRIGNDVTVHANGGIEAGAWGTEFRAETGYGRTLQQVPAPRLPAPAS